MQQLALEQIRKASPAEAQQYAAQWAEGIARAVTDSGTEPLSERRMAALREAVVQSAADEPQMGPLREHYAWWAAAVRYGWAPLVRLPDLTPRQMRQIDRQVEELAEHVAKQVRRTLAELDPAIADKAAATAASEFTRVAMAGRANPCSLLLKEPLAPDQVEKIKWGFNARFAKSDKMLHFLLRTVKNPPEKRVEAMVIQARFAMMNQITALVPRAQYPEDVLALQKAYADASLTEFRRRHEK